MIDYKGNLYDFTDQITFILDSMMSCSFKNQQYLYRLYRQIEDQKK